MYKKTSGLFQIYPFILSLGMALVMLIAHHLRLIDGAVPPLASVDVCHAGTIKSINSNALNGHLSHGDVQLIDNDGDGYYTDISPCSSLIDCDDSDPTITTCAIIAVGSPHPTYGGIVFEIDGFGGGKLVSCVPLNGLNFGYVDVQHITRWTTSRTDGEANTDKLLLVHPNFDPVVASRAKGAEWYLPSIEEVELIYKELFLTGTSPFSAGYYLSSTDSGSSRIKAFSFSMSSPSEISYSHYGLGAYTLCTRAF